MHLATTTGRVNGEALARISTGLVQLYSRYCGKGPTRAKTNMTGDIVVCILQDAYTRPERTLLDVDDAETVQRMRAGFNRVMEADSRRIIEENCGRRVIACLAATHVDPDLTIEIFVLESVDEDPPHVGVSPAAPNGPPA